MYWNLDQTEIIQILKFEELWETHARHFSDKRLIIYQNFEMIYWLKVFSRKKKFVNTHLRQVQTDFLFSV